MKVRSKRVKTSNQPLLKNKVKQNKNSPRSSLMTSVLWRGGDPRTSHHTTGRPRRAATDRNAQSGHGTLERGDEPGTLVSQGFENDGCESLRKFTKRRGSGLKVAWNFDSRKEEKILDYLFQFPLNLINILYNCFSD